LRTLTTTFYITDHSIKDFNNAPIYQKPFLSLSILWTQILIATTEPPCIVVKTFTVVYRPKHTRQLSNILWRISDIYVMWNRKSMAHPCVIMTRKTRRKFPTQRIWDIFNKNRLREKCTWYFAEHFEIPL